MAVTKSIGICSHRLGGTDGVSIEAAKWQKALAHLGFDIVTIAGSGAADVIISELAAASNEAVPLDTLARALDRVDLVVVENICSLKLNVLAADAIAKVLSGRRAIFRHHDLAIERNGREHLGPPPVDPHWQHVCISHLARERLAGHGITATVVYNRFDPDPPLGDRTTTRRHLDLSDDEVVMLQPTRAIERKAVAIGLGLAERLGATYWLLGPPEDGFDAELNRILAKASTRVIRWSDLPTPIAIADAYAACDVVTLPSTWEGFGNPSIESATHHRPLAVGSYPVSTELAAFGFRWFSCNDASAVNGFLVAPDFDLLGHNAKVAKTYFSLADLPRELAVLIEQQ